MEDSIRELYRMIKKNKINSEEAINKISDFRKEKKENSFLKHKETNTKNNIINEDIVLKRSNLYLKELLSSELKIPVQKIDQNTGMDVYGIDSFMILQLTDRLEKVFGPLPKTLFFEYQTVEELAKYFIKMHSEKLYDLLGITNKSGNEENKDTILVSKEKFEIPKKISEKINKVSSVDIKNVNINSKKKIRKDNVEINTTQEQHKNNDLKDIAIIGLAGKYPKAENVNELWLNLMEGKNCVTEIPKDRWDYNIYFDKQKGKLGKTYSKWGGFLDGVYEFDPLFFNISPKEAEQIDPQERLFLECVYKTIEDAGYTKSEFKKIKGNGLEGNIGVFVGVMYEEYQLYGAQEQSKGNMISLSGIPSSIANRVSYYFNLHGPSISVDTMCSSSLTSIHLACKSLQNSECEMAIAGGVNVSVHPNKYLLLGRNTFLSSKGKCESFGEGGDGYVPGEGVGAILLKPLSKAIKDRDHIYGVIKGTAINHGGKTNGYTVPNPKAQSDVISRAYKDANINPRKVSYIEAHGTGTSLGDPIEITSLNNAFSLYTQDTDFCKIGSIKSNIGHCESAAGIAGVTKVLLQMQHHKLVPSLHSEVLNPNIQFKDTPFIVQKEVEEWKRPVINIDGEEKEYPLLAGISAFGAGGSNAHVVIEEYIEEEKPQVVSLAANVFVFSAKNKLSLKESISNINKFILSKDYKNDKELFQNIAYTLQVGREEMIERVAVVATSLEDLSNKLVKYLNNEEYIDGLYFGNTKDVNIKSIFEGNASKEFIKALFKEDELDKIAELWVSGIKIDWNLVYTANSEENINKLPLRISMPGYSFLNKTYFAVHNTNDRNVIYPKNEVEVQNINDSKSKEEFLYVPRWDKEELNDGKYENEIKNVEKVVFIYPEGANNLVDKIAKYYINKNIVKVKLSTENKKDFSSQYIVDVNNPDSFTECINQIKDIDMIYYLGGIINEEINTEDINQFDTKQNYSVIGMFRLAKALIKNSYDSKKIEIKVVTNNVYKILSDDKCIPYSSGLYGLLKSMSKEFLSWKISAIDIDLVERSYISSEYENQIEMLVKESNNISSSEVVIRENNRYVRKLYPIELSAAEEVQFKDGGVYFIAGGTGGIGLALCSYLADKIKCKFVLTGRSKFNSIIEEKLEKIKSKGCEAIYIQADLIDRYSMERAISRTKETFGKISGVIHSAIVLKDQSLLNMSEETFIKVLNPKVKGSLVLYNLIKNENLDFLMYFSSAQSFVGSAGQSNYSAACSFKDAFALYQSYESNYPIKIVNWGYWGEVGIVAKDEYNAKLASRGIYSLKTEEGMDVIQRVLKNDENQVVAIKSDKSLMKKIGAAYNYTIKSYSNSEESISLDQINSNEAPKLSESDLEEVDKSFGKLREFSRTLLLDVFQQEKIFLRSNERYNKITLFNELKIGKQYKRLFDTMLDILVSGDYISQLNEDEYISNNLVESESVKYDVLHLKEQKDHLCKVYPMIEAYINFIWVCYPYFWKILKNEVLATEIIFPNSSMDIVGKIYTDNKVADYLNEIVTWFVREYIEKLYKSIPVGKKIKILEIGAGTGGTSNVVFKGIKQYGDKLEYMYTDISEAFLKYGKTKFGKENPYLKFKTLNIEENVIDQGFVGGEYDVIIATNVLHATKNIKNTIRNAKVLLKNNGFLVLNEITKVEEFLTLTFGLLNGWWLYEDEEYRLKGSPALSSNLWDKVLTEEGYKNVRTFDEYSKNILTQSIVISQSNGKVKILNNEDILPSKNYVQKAKNEENKKVQYNSEDKIEINNNISEIDIDTYIEEEILNSISEVLEIDKNQLSIEVPYSEYGVDSILSGQITSKINEKLDIEISSTALFNYPTSAKLRDYIIKEFKGKIKINNTKNYIEEANNEDLYKVNNKTVKVKAKNSNNQIDIKIYVEDQILNSLSEILEIEKNQLDIEIPYSEYGVDSILSGQITSKINEKLGTEINSTALFNYPTSAKLRDYIIKEYKDEINVNIIHVESKEIEENQDKYIDYSVKESEIKESKENKKDKSMDIAIIGMAGKFPGASTLDEYWSNLVNKKDCVEEIDRWDPDSYYDSNPDVPNKSYINKSGMLKDVDKFDPLFFNISPREAELMDPQQRLFLEAAWSALEDAGISDNYINEKKCGVFVGAMESYYGRLVEEYGVEKSNYVFNGTIIPMLSARISYLLNLRGPSIVVSTACSSALVAIHLACESIINKTSEIAIAGGVNAFPTPFFHVLGSSTGMFSYKGTCAPFDNEADGFIPAEGCGAVILKSLDKAIQDGDHIYGVIAGSGINQDGKSNGITAPSAPSQADLECEVYNRYDINPEDISYIETHGTGTKLGDPIEIEALTQAFSRFTDKKQFCPIGSVKSNIGHSLQASGAASLIKVLLCMKHKKLVPTINFKSENELIPFKKSPVYVNTEYKDWITKPGVPRMAAISAFGISGTNAHLVVKEYEDNKYREKPSNPYYLVPISAKNKKDLNNKLKDLKLWIENDNYKNNLGDISYTLLMGRTHFSYRLALIVKTVDELSNLLAEAIEGIENKNCIIGDFISNGFRQDSSIVKLGNNVIEELEKESLSDEKYMEKVKYIAKCYVEGYKFEWGKLYNSYEYKKISLPTYPFANKSYWVKKNLRTNKADAGENNLLRLHPLVGKNTATLKEQKYTTVFNEEEFFISGHQVGKDKVMPGVAYLEMARAAGELAAEEKVYSIKNVLWGKPIVVNGKEEVNITLNPNEDGEVEFEVYTFEDGLRVSHAHGNLSFDQDQDDYKLQEEIMDLDDIKGRCNEVILGYECYDLFRKMELNYGSDFQSIEKMYVGSGEALSVIKLPEELRNNFNEFNIHPSIMDGVLQTVVGMIMNEIEAGDTYLLFFIGEVKLIKPITSECYSYVTMTHHNYSDKNKLSFNIVITNNQGEVLATVSNYNVRKFTKNKSENELLEKLKLLENGSLKAYELENMMEGYNE